MATVCMTAVERHQSWTSVCMVAMHDIAAEHAWSASNTGLARKRCDADAELRLCKSAPTSSLSIHAYWNTPMHAGLIRDGVIRIGYLRCATQLPQVPSKHGRADETLLRGQQRRAQRSAEQLLGSQTFGRARKLKQHCACATWAMVFTPLGITA